MARKKMKKRSRRSGGKFFSKKNALKIGLVAAAGYIAVSAIGDNAMPGIKEKLDTMAEKVKGAVNKA